MKKNKKKCPDCGENLKFIDELHTDWYGVLKYYKCKKCKEIYVSRDNEELSIAAP